MGRAGQAPRPLPVPTGSPLRTTPQSPLLPRPSCPDTQHIPPRPAAGPALPPAPPQIQPAALAMLGPQPIGGDGGTMGKTCHYSVPAGMGGQWGKRKGETCSEHTQPSNQGSAEVPGGTWVVKCPGGEGWGGPGNACWGQDAKAVCTVQLSENHPTQAASPPTYKIRKKEERNGGREGGRTNTGDTSLSPGACRRPAASLIVSSVAAATKECRLPHPYPRRLNNHLTRSLLHG